MIFNKIAVAITFSQNTMNLLNEAKRLKELFQSELFIFHIGEKSDDKKSQLKKIIDDANLNENEYKLIWETGDIDDSIMNLCEINKINLLIAGALKKENMLKYYLGSVARTLMREAPCSVLFYLKQNEKLNSYKNICVNVDFTRESEIATLKAYEIAKLENSENLTLLREFQMPNLVSSAFESDNKDDIRIQKNNLHEDEIEKMKLFVNELNLTGIKINTYCLLGKHGWELSNWVSENKYDLLVIPSLQRKPKLIDRIFQYDWEFIFKELPSSLLIVKPENY